MKTGSAVFLTVVVPIVSLLGACGSGGGASPDAGSEGGAGGAGGETTGAGGEDGGAPDGPPPVIVHPNPIISRGKMVYSSPPGGSVLVDGMYHNGGGAWNAMSPTEAAPAWAAIKLDPGPTRVLVSWDDGGTYNYRDPLTVGVFGLPLSYEIAVSPDSTNGADGTWTPAVTVPDNHVRTRAHSIDFTGQSWVKMTITAAPPNAGIGVRIAEIDVHDISATGAGLPDDTWFFMGDSITAFAYDRALAQAPSFATLVNTAAPAYFPAMINGGIGSELTATGLARLDEALSLNPDYRYFAIGYGTNDAAGMQVPIATFRTNLQTLIDRIKTAGRTPILAHIPFSGDGTHNAIPAYNAVIDELTAGNGLHVGPDLYTHFMEHPEELMSDRLHPNDPGQRAMNQLWFDAVRGLYP